MGLRHHPPGAAGAGAAGRRSLLAGLALLPVVLAGRPEPARAQSAGAGAGAGGAAGPAPVVAAAAPGVAAPPELATLWPRLHLQGQAVMRVLGLHIADLRLWLPEPPAAAWAAEGDAGWRGRELALELQYARRFEARSLAQRSLQEMQRGGPIEPPLAERWLQALGQLFPDVERGDRITGHQLPERSARFFHNGRWRGELADAQFVPRFFAIWLGERSSQPALRGQLLGTAR